mmetsp:Transcript_10561/g.30077  ORF Transcript_10561/g.30077 Transcript_10561/m.30077 type:complete len:334 (-) Transcript_10561:15-1016(-)
MIEEADSYTGGRLCAKLPSPAAAVSAFGIPIPLAHTAFWREAWREEELSERGPAAAYTAEMTPCSKSDMESLSLDPGHLLFPFEEDDTIAASSDDGKSEFAKPGGADDVLHLTVGQLSAFSVPKNALVGKLLQDTMTERQACVERNGTCNLDLLAERLRDLGHDVMLRNGIGGGSGYHCLVNLRHRFMYVLQPSDDGTEEELIVVDPNFRDQFLISSCTPRYQAVLNSLPLEFVGTKHQLVGTVALLCDEVQFAFVENRLRVPPWRQLRSVLSKWFPASVRDTLPGEASKTSYSAPEAHHLQGHIASPHPKFPLCRSSRAFRDRCALLGASVI